MLKINDLHVSYGKIEALKGISLEVSQGEIVALIGSNGAGKTTTLRTISGLEKPSGGTITFLDQDLTKLEKSYKDKDDGTKELEIDDLEIFENVAYVMALHADPSIPGDINEWLDQFEMFSIYEILPEILELWGSNLFTDVKARKN